MKEKIFHHLHFLIFLIIIVCLTSPAFATEGSSRSELPSGPNPLTDGSPELKERLRNALGDESFNAITQDKHRPTVAFVHIEKLKEDILTKAEFKKDTATHFFSQTRIPVYAGEEIGKVRKQFDFAVVNTEKRLSGFVIPVLYRKYR